MLQQEQILGNYLAVGLVMMKSSDEGLCGREAVRLLQVRYTGEPTTETIGKKRDKKVNNLSVREKQCNVSIVDT